MPGPAMAAAACEVAAAAAGAHAAGADYSLDGTVQPTKLFIGGISRRTTTKQLRDHFSKCGRVLDCVAMRQPDGRPRGFGYVTLDSPAAARHYLSEPQLIDNRYVDLKPAVPDASMAAQEVAGARARWPMQAQDCAPAYPAPGLPAQGLCLPIMAAPAWRMAEGALDFDSASPLSLLTRHAAPTALPPAPERSPESFAQFAGLLSRPVAPGEPLREPLREATPAKVQLPAAAPPAAPRPAPAPAPASENEAPAFIPAAAKAPLREVTNLPLREVTNLVKDEGIKRERRVGLACPEPIKPVGPSPRSALALVPASRMPPLMEREDSFFILADEDVAPSTFGQPRSPSPAPSAGSVDSGSTSQPSSGSPCEDMPLPTVGSAKHASGECRRCNFFAKGRCRNGFDCSFCHLPHDRRKLSRQEKREAKLSRSMSQQQGSSPASEPASEPAPARSAGGSPLGPSEESDFTPSAGNALALALSAEAEEPEARFVQPPPGLARGAPGVALPPGLAPPGLPLPPHLEGGLAPPRWPAPAAGPLLATSPPAAGRPAAAPAAETRTVATQTEEDYPCCPRCAGRGVA